ncbi:MULTISPECIES: Fe2+-dependent dioxygenase [Trichocoleus]|uniref:Fe2+-dependent dioxygenase n=1 Tax=Trichocoleus desertorum GB2-A4 TaxID=2933944 RepID=A0ABV0J4N7_9CYAN|nr:Fe2+-dependent dioxygenase [Trichocoleus sp. FACHB-46]MBD1861565.1 Fe2+-dependent dioxygenase [Trichocoleus sp. FACHB-46]
MMLTIPDVLTSEELNSVVSNLDASDFVDGKTTAGWHAKLVKQNTQLKNEASYSQELKETIKNALRRNPLFQIAVQPRLIHSMLFSLYESGMSYGSHIDNALMGGQEFWRSDVSLTLFLSSPSSYGGGELVIEGVEGETTFKLEAGSAIVYPSSTLHRVNPVTEGVRLVAVAWVQSLVRDPHKREILFDLDVARRALFEKQGKTTEFDLISKSHANLLRQWADA